MRRHRFVLGGVLLGAVWWCAEAVIHVVVLEEGNLAEQLLPSDPNEIWMRMVVALCFVGFGLVAQRAVNQRERAAGDVRVAEQWLRPTLRRVGDGVITTDVLGRIEFLNPEASRVTGWAADEARGRPMSEVFCIVDEETNQPAENPVERVFRDKRAVGPAKHTVLMAKDGMRRPVAESGALITTTAGEIRGVVLVFRDVTREREQEAALRQHQKLESIGTLAAGVAHEVNNPLSGILNFGELLRIDLPAGSEQHEYAEGIVEESRRIARIVESLLQFSRQEQEPHGTARLGDIVRSTLLLAGATLRRANIGLFVEVPEDLPCIQCRTQRIQQVVVNLLNNARDALDERYPEGDEHKRLEVRGRLHRDQDQDQDWIRLTVEDHGWGVPAEIRERIFDPFFTTKPREKATGLGLAVSLGIAHDHGGRLLLETEERRYSRFHLDLPLPAEADVESAGRMRSEGENG